jgi:ornithine carbamoyltransferase
MDPAGREVGVEVKSAMGAGVSVALAEGEATACVTDAVSGVEGAEVVVTDWQAIAARIRTDKAKNGRLTNYSLSIKMLHYKCPVLQNNPAGIYFVRRRLI